MNPIVVWLVVAAFVFFAAGGVFILFPVNWKHIFIHNWSKWVTTERGNIMRSYFIGRSCPQTVGTYIIQERTCATCGKIQSDRVDTDH